METKPFCMCGVNVKFPRGALAVTRVGKSERQSETEAPVKLPGLLC